MNRKIEIEEDIYNLFNIVRRVTGESFSEIIRRLIPGDDASGMQIAPRSSVVIARKSPQEAATGISEPDQKFISHIRGASFRSLRSSVDRFLFLLSHLYKENSSQFHLLESLRGRERKYFAKSKRELEESGESVNAKEIGNSSYWVVTNNSSRDKGKLLASALRLLGYSEPAASEAQNCFGN